MTLPCFQLEPAEPPRASILMLHGLGADGTDFLPIADEMDLSAVGPLRWVFPRAPERPVTVNGGMRMRAWYDIRGSELVRQEDEDGLRASFAAVLGLIEREIARGVPARRIVLAGFSQGCAITLGAGLRCPHRLAGLAGLSGYLPMAARTAAERHAANHDTPIFMAHGSQDPVVPLQRGVDSRDALQALGAQVAWHSYPMAHAVCLEEIQAFNHWLLATLA